MRFLITPRWLALHAVFLLALAFCLVAGWWQYGVYQDSQARHNDREATPVPVSELVHPGEAVGEAADRAVVAEGTYLTDHRRFVPGRIHEGVLGWFVLLPLETNDGSVIPVVQGWVAEREDAQTPPATPVRVTGHLLPAEVPEHATVRSDQVLDDEELAYIAPESIEADTGLSAATSIHGYLVLASEDPSTAGIARLNIQEVAPIREVNPWQNLSYWAQWWVFGLAALVFWGSAIRSGIRSRRDTGSEGPGAEMPDRPGDGGPGDAELASATGLDTERHARISAPGPRRVPS
nr:SURF1 family protein [Phytoactinopolyspora mesophila]